MYAIQVNKVGLKPIAYYTLTRTKDKFGLIQGNLGLLQR